MANYDAIIIGSGFGGAITAAKLTRAGARVLILEQGHRWRLPQQESEKIRRDGNEIVNKWNVNDPVTGYPKSPGDSDPWDNPNYVLQQNTDLKYVFYQFPGSQNRSGGLFEDFDSEENPNGPSTSRFFVTVGRAYGGGSIVYSMIHLRAPSETFDSGANGGVRWPEDYTRARLDPYYDRVETILPIWQLSYDTGSRGLISKRASVLADAFARAGIHCDPIRLNLWGDRFSQYDEPRQRNHLGVEVHPCVGCGFCTYGCIFGAKGTMPSTYLAIAERTGNLTVRTDAQAWSIQPRQGGYTVVWNDMRMNPPQPHEEHARVVVSSGGAIGSPELLLRSQALGLLPDLSPHLGYHVSGGGDSGFGLLFESLPEEFKAEIFKGSIINLVSYHPWLHPVNDIRFVLEDLGTQPLGISKFPVRREVGDIEPRAIHDCNTDPTQGAQLYWGRYWKAMIKENYAHNVLGVGSVGLDAPDGQVEVDPVHYKAQVRWNTRLAPGNRTFDLIQAAAAILDQLVAASPYRAQRLHTYVWDDLRRYTTIHPVGGCRMSETGATGADGGVVDPTGQVYNYPGLYVIDGSVMPGSIGVNPSATISAVAEKMSDAILHRGG